MITKLNLDMAASGAPTEFRIFTAEQVDTVKGLFVFDAKAAAAVMTHYEAHGIDLAIDYDHAMLGAGAALDPAQAGKAAGWFNLEMRGGELWAVNVRWTGPAAEALARKEWRFVSPAFTTDAEGRITSLVNVAITNIPATRRLEPLVAANAEMNMDASSLVQQALDALIAGDSEKCAEILKEMIVAAASGQAPPDATPPAPAAKAKDRKVPESSDGQPLPAGTRAEAQAANQLFRLTSTSTLAGAAAQVQAMSVELQKLQAERDAFANAERTRLCSRLVVEGGKSPASVWADPFTPGVPKPFLNRMSLVELREHVEAEIRSVPKGKKTVVRAPIGNGDGTQTIVTHLGDYDITLEELHEVKRAGTTPEAFAIHKLSQERRLTNARKVGG